METSQNNISFHIVTRDYLSLVLYTQVYISIVQQSGADEIRKYTEIILVISISYSHLKLLVNITFGEFAHKCSVNAVADYRIWI